MAMESCDTEVALLRKALAAGLLMNAVQLVDTAADISDPSSAGVNIYRILRSTGPGLAFYSFILPPQIPVHCSVSTCMHARPLLRMCIVPGGKCCNAKRH